MWGFYPDAVNPHRVGYVTVTWPVDYTYWVEPAWMHAYSRLVASSVRLIHGRFPDPSPPAPLMLPAGPGRISTWDDARHARAKVTCWQLTGNGWAPSRIWLLRHGLVEA